MSKIGLLKAMSLCGKYNKMSAEERSAVRERRLQEMIDWARTNSPYYKELYKNAPESPKLTDLPPVNKRDLMSRFDEWTTDRSLKLSDLNDYMKDLDNIGRKYQGKYLVFTTSGSTGEPLVAVCDSTTNNLMGAINAGRTFARKEDLKAFFKRGGKTVGVFATGGFYLGNSSVRARLLSMPWKKRQMAISSALLPTEEIVSLLNEFQPAMLGGYPSNLELLIDEQKSGRLKINPVLIMTGGEYLSEELRAKLSEAFNCFVQTSYACTEGGTIACECTEHHFHINDDWIILEPVDKDNNPAPCGVRSDKVLLTNLFNFTQPFIRYEVTDRVVMHDEPCACGNRSPWLTLEGRTDDVISFTEAGKKIQIPPLAVYAVLKEVHELRRFQLVSYKDNKAELRLIPADGIEKEKAFRKAKETLEAFLLTHGVKSAVITLSCEEPKQHEKSGKFKHIVNAAKE